MEFRDVVHSEAELRELMGDPVAPPVVEKTLAFLDQHCRAFIGRSPFVLISSSDNKGRMDISPKGDRFDTFSNLFQSPRVGMIFLIPGKRETLRVGGSAQIVRDSELLQSMAVNGKVPGLATVVNVDEAFFHCSKCMIRSRLWQPEHWPALEGLPTLAETMKDASSFQGPVDALEGVIREDEEKRLY
jgi:predicted pyridoxine 5'-phosphate oxidase superfamily flavin-nucleotide-binding protein